MAGIYDEIEKHRYETAEKLNEAMLDKIIEGFTSTKVESPRGFVLYTGELGMILFDLAVLGIHIDTTVIGHTKHNFRKCKTRYYFSLFNKDGMYKAIVRTSPARFDLYRGTEFLWSVDKINYNTVRSLKIHELRYDKLESKQKPIW